MKLDRVFAYKFGSIYPHYIQKVEKKNRTKEELDQVLRWLTGYSQKELERQIPGARSSPASCAEFASRRSKIPSCGRSATWTSSSMSSPRARPWRRSCGSELETGPTVPRMQPRKEGDLADERV